MIDLLHNILSFKTLKKQLGDLLQKKAQTLEHGVWVWGWINWGVHIIQAFAIFHFDHLPQGRENLKQQETTLETITD